MDQSAAESASALPVVVIGAGPAGMLLSFLLARQRIPVVLLESQPDFDRKFRGDTFHSSALDLMDDLGTWLACRRAANGRPRSCNSSRWRSRSA